MAEIAVSVTIEVLKKTSNIIADLILNEGSRFFQMREEISWVEREMRRIQSYLKDVENMPAKSERVANLINDIRDLSFDVDTMEKYFYPSHKDKVKGLKRFFKKIPRTITELNSERNFLLEIEAIKKRVEDLNRARLSYGINEQVSGMERDDWNDRRSFPHVEEPNITGFENHTRNLVAKLEDEDLSLRVISITGMPGLGKTTLAKKVYNSVKRSFKLTAWVYVSEQPIIKTILQDIARQVGLKIENWEDGGEAKLYGHLRLNNHLLVIDDIWHTKTWDALRIAIPTNSQNRSRIILTSRHRDVGVHVGDWSSLYELKPLEKNHSKQLFQSSLGIIESENDPPGLKEIGNQILHRCGGVPLAIVVVSGLLKLRVRSVIAWNSVLELMDKGPEELSKTYMLSYIDLPIKLKPCFLYFGIFPEDQEIGAFELINLWVAEGFIKGSDSREFEEVGDDYLNHLVARNLIQLARKDVDGKVMSCRIHDILHNLCIQVAKDINFFTISTDLTHSNFSTVRRVTDHGIGLNDNISSNHQTPKIRSFLFFKGGYLSSQSEKSHCDFFKDLNLVRVLYFEESISHTFAKKVWTLKNLTYLKLQINGDFEIIDSIIFLENLVTLDLQRFGLGSFRLVFPMVIWNMKQLRHLLLSVYFIVKPTYKGFDRNAIKFQNFQTLQVPPEIFEEQWLHKLSKLRNLILNCHDDKKGDSYEKIGNIILCSTLVPPVLYKLETLKVKAIYGIVEERMLQVTKLKMSGYQNLTYLFLYNVGIEQWPQPAELPPNLTEVVLGYCVLKEDPLQVMKNMPKLRALKLFNGNYALGKLICTGEPDNFPQLRQLFICVRVSWGLETTIPYQEISEITIEDRGMPKLEEFITMDAEVTLKLPTTIERIWQHIPYDYSLFEFP